MTNKTIISSYLILITLLLGQYGFAYSDAIARNFFRKSTRELNQILPSTNPYTNISNVEYQQMRTVLNALDEIDSVLAEFLTTLPTNVFNNVDALPINKKYAFMFDFEKRADDILELSINPHLIDDWAEIAHLTLHRKSIKFLESYNFIAKSPQCQILRVHLFQGHFYPSGNVGGWHHIFGTVNQNSYGRIDNIIDPPDTLGYYSANVSIFNGTAYIPKVNYSGNLIRNDMFPRTWTEQELLENISLAYTNKIFTGVGNQFEGIMSDGKRLIICINGNSSVIVSTTNIKTVWPKN
jgi:hypothetical protein